MATDGGRGMLNGTGAQTLLAASASPRPRRREERRVVRVWSSLLLAGGLAAGWGTVLHPTVIALASWRRGLTAVVHTPWWTAVHLVFAAGLGILLLAAAGLAHLCRRRGRHRGSTLVRATLRWARWAFLAALPLWWVAIAAEVTLVAPLAWAAARSGWLPGPDPVATPAAAEATALAPALLLGVWAFPRLAGYLAAGLMWVGVALWAWTLLRGAWILDVPVPPWLAAWGLAGGLLALAGLPVGAMVAARWAVWVTGLSSGLAALWVLAVGGWLWRRSWEE